MFPPCMMVPMSQSVFLHCGPGMMQAWLGLVGWLARRKQAGKQGAAGRGSKAWRDHRAGASLDSTEAGKEEKLKMYRGNDRRERQRDRLREDRRQKTQTQTRSTSRQTSEWMTARPHAHTHARTREDPASESTDHNSTLDVHSLTSNPSLPKITYPSPIVAPCSLVVMAPSSDIKRILIPGGAGYIGSHVVLACLLTRRYKVTGELSLSSFSLKSSCAWSWS